MDDFVLVATLALIDNDGRILISKRPPYKPFGGLWEFPGGKIKRDETPEKALIREIKEEINVNIEESCIAPLTFSSVTYDKSNFIILLYVSRKWKNNPIHQEGGNIKWVRPNDLKKYEMPKGNVSLCSSLNDLIY